MEPMKSPNGQKTAPVFLALSFLVLVTVSSGEMLSQKVGNLPHPALGLGVAGDRVCDQTANIVKFHCTAEAWNDYLLELAKAVNLLDADERASAFLAALEDARDTVGECTEQQEARLELCEELGEDRYHPVIDVNDFVDPTTDPNSYFPLVPGTTLIYEGETEDGTERIEVTVTDETKEVLGVTCTVVVDQVFLDGQLIEDTRDYYAQDIAGNVWYFGENSLEIEDGEVVSLGGSWTAGVDGAKPGIIMMAEPEFGGVYRQEYALTEAEDAASVLGLSETVEVLFGVFTDCLMTADFTPIEPDVLELKFYAPGVGLVLEVNPETGERIELVDVIEPES